MLGSYKMSNTNFCQKCGAKLEEGVKFCSSCGASTETKEPIQEQPPQTTEEQQTQPVSDEALPTATTTLTPPTQDEKNKLFLLMAISIIIMPVGFVLAIIQYNKKENKAALHYLMCGLSGVAFAMGSWYWAGFVIGAILIASTVYTGIQSINKGEIKLNY